LSPEDGLEWLDSHSDRNGETDQQRRSMLSVASPFSDSPGTVHLLEPRQGSNALLAGGLCRGEISGPFILDTAGTRHLYFDLRAVQSSMRLEEPDVLVTAYAQKMMAFLLFNRAPRHILMIGLGGGSLVKFCHRHLQDTRLTVVEIDPDIIELRDWFQRGRYCAHLEKIRRACPGPVLLVPVELDGNVLIFAFAQPAHTWTLESVEATAEELQSDLALEFPRFLQRLRAGHLLPRSSEWLQTDS